MIRSRALLASSLLVLAASSCLVACANDAAPAGEPAKKSAPPVAASEVPAASVGAGGSGRVLSWIGPSEPVPAGTSYPDAARMHLTHIAPRLGIAERAVARLVEGPTHDTGHGAVVASFVQKVDGVEVLDGDVRVVLRRDASLVAVSGRVLPITNHGYTFSLTPREAVARAITDATGETGARGAPVAASTLVDDGAEGSDYERVTSLPGGPKMDSPARGKRVLVPRGDGLTAAYEVEIFVTGIGDYRALVDANDGAVLERTSLVDDAFAYTVFAEPNGDYRPFDGPQENFTPHPRGVPDGSNPAFVAPNVVAMDGFNKNPAGTFDPWLAPGATETRGNNVDAYTDVVAPNGFSEGDLRATVTAPGVFARVYDTSLGPLASADQQMASVTQLFFVNNWLHDYFYDSGFTEAAGNAQVNNFGRGGIGNDPLLVEAQDGYPTSRNNANMSTPADGRSPRMQMFVYDGPLVRQTLTLAGGPNVAANAGPYSPPSYDVTADVVLANDGDATPTDACAPLVNDVTGKIVLVDLGGGCTSASKAMRITAAGAVGMIAADDVAAANAPTLGNTAGFPGPYVPTLAVRKVDGDALRASLAGGPVTARMDRLVSAERDGAQDNTVVAHEWGHYLHHRLARCSTHQCRAMSEGFGDFSALHMLLREGDDLGRTYGRAIYSGRARRDSGYFGNRRYPYSTDRTKNPLTFANIMDSVALPTGIPNASTGSVSSEVHNAGEIWANALFEVYTALLTYRATPRPFAVTRRIMADALVAGLRATPPNATFTEQRSAILAALFAADPADAEAAGLAFAKRKMGVCAVSPADPDSVDFAGVVEDDGTADVVIEDVRVDDSSTSCDRDGVLDGGEAGLVRVTLANRGTTAAPAAVTVSTTATGVSFPNGLGATNVRVPALGKTSVTVPIALDKDTKGHFPVTLDVSALGSPSCSGTATRKVALRFETDTKRDSSRVDDVEAEESRWVSTGVAAKLVWERRTVSALDHLWHASNLAVASDTQLVSIPVTVSRTEPFVISFRHRYTFDGGPTSDPASTDGGVVELSEDDGLTWKDMTEYGLDPYTGRVAPAATTALAGKRAFVGKSSASLTPVTLELAKVLSGKRVRVRFRLVTDSARGAAGWDLDDIGFGGIDERPFATVVDDEGTCNRAPVANAGDDVRAEAGTKVVLDGSKSADPNGDTLAHEWIQTAGPPVALEDSRAARASFVAPDVKDEVPFAFELRVSDSVANAKDEVSVVVYARAEVGNAAPTAEASGCSCEAAGGGSSARGVWAGMAALGVFALVRGRRRRRP